MLMLNEIEEKVRSELIKIAKRGNRGDSRISYQDLADLCGLRDENGERYDMSNIKHRNDLGHILGNISRYEVIQFDRPMLSALVFNEQIDKPGKGFFDLARDLKRQKVGQNDLEFWAVELNEVFEKWSK